MSPTITPAPQAAQATEPEKQFASIIPEENRLRLEQTVSTVSHHDMPHVQYVVTGDNDEIYNKFSERRKKIITAVLSFCGFLAPVSSTTVLSAVPEVAGTYQCDGAIINLSNALYMLFMGISPCFYGPFGNIYGRRWVRNYPNIPFVTKLLNLGDMPFWHQIDSETNPNQVSVVSAVLFFAFSLGTALAPNLAAFFVFRILTAFQGTAFLVIGSSVIGDIYKPVSIRS